MSSAADPITIAAEQVRTLVAAVPALAAKNVPVLTEKAGDLVNTITRAINKLGLGIVVIVPDGQILKRSGDKLRQRVRIVVEISELVTLNQGATGTQIGALTAAVLVMKALDGQPNGNDPAGTMHRPGNHEFTLDDDLPFVRRPDPRAAYLIYHVTAYTEVML